MKKKLFKIIITLLIILFIICMDLYNQKQYKQCIKTNNKNACIKEYFTSKQY
jgi:uncharacterized alpha/beta hydrolase family protein